MIEPEQDMLDPEAQICRGDFPGTRRGLDNERRFRRRKPFSLRRTAETFDPHQHVRGRARQALDRNGLSREPAVAPDRAAFGVGAAVETGPRRRHVIRAFGQIDVDRQPEVIAPRRNLEKQAVGVGRRLTQLQIARPDFVRLRRVPEQRTQNAKEHREASHRAVSDAAALGGVSTTIW